jgi:hypothetical protein
VRSADEERLIGRGDGEVLERATALHRVVVTHDLAFGKGRHGTRWNRCWPRQAGGPP